MHTERISPQKKASQTNQRYLPPINESQGMKDEKGNICLHRFQEPKNNTNASRTTVTVVPYMLAIPLLFPKSSSLGFYTLLTVPRFRPIIIINTIFIITR